MVILKLFTSLTNIGAVASWIASAVYGVLLTIDGAIYSIVSYAFKVFMLMCNLNFNVIYGIAAPIVDIVQALVMVFVVFKVGVALIGYMLEPEKASKDGSKLIVNIFITAAMLIGYQFVFNVFNELSMLIMGNQTGYPYTTLSTIADLTDSKDEGLIMRALFGSNEEIEVGEYLAYQTLAMFAHDAGKPESSNYLQATICKSDSCDFSKLSNLSSEVGKNVEYHILLPFAVGIYLIYSLVKSAISLGIRMFKLLILQILAPVAIITCISDGTKSSTFQTFIKKYFAVYIEAFTRMASMLIIVVFVSKFFMNIGDFFGNLTTEGGFTKTLITVLVIVAAFKFAGDIPKFLDEALGTKMASGDGKGGFGHFVGGMLGAGAGFFGGLVAGAGGGGLGGAIVGAGKGLIGGATSGYKGNNVADFFKGQKEVRNNALSQGQSIRARGGLGNVMLGNIPVVSSTIRNSQDRQIAALDRQSSILSAYDNDSASELKQMGATAGSLRLDDFKDDSGFASAYTEASRQFTSDGLKNVKMSSKDEYKEQMREYNTEYRKAKSELAAAEQSGDNRRIENARLELARKTKIADDAAGDMYEAARAALARKEGTHTHSVAENYRKLSKTTGDINVKKEQRRISEEKYKITDTNLYSINHGQNPKDK